MAVVDAPIEEGTHALTDGRTLRWALWGVPGGTPVVFCHGNPSSRLFRFGRAAIESAGVRFVTVDRPGCGGSTPRPGRRMIDWAADVRELADGLGLDRFGLVGMSMGGPHALACAAALNGRVTAVAVHGSPGPWSDPALFAEPAARRLALEDATEAVRPSSEGFFEERMAGYVLDWGFRLARSSY